MTPDGRFVVFLSSATTLVSGGAVNPSNRAYRFDRSTAALTRLRCRPVVAVVAGVDGIGPPTISRRLPDSVRGDLGRRPRRHLRVGCRLGRGPTAYRAQERHPKQRDELIQRLRPGDLGRRKVGRVHNRRDESWPLGHERLSRCVRPQCRHRGLRADQRRVRRDRGEPPLLEPGTRPRRVRDRLLLRRHEPRRRGHRVDE